MVPVEKGGVEHFDICSCCILGAETGWQGRSDNEVCVCVWAAGVLLGVCVCLKGERDWLYSMWAFAYVY